VRDNATKKFIEFAIMPQESTSSYTTSDIKAAFDSALSLHQEKKWDGATEAYKNLLQNDKFNLSNDQLSVVYQNLAQISFEKSEYLNSYIWSKKSLALNGHNQFAKETLKIVSEKFAPPTVPHEISNFEQFQRVISYTPVDFWWILSVLSFFLLLKLAFNRFLIGRSKAAGEKNFKSSMIFIFLLFFTLASVCITFARNDLANVKYGLISAEIAKIQTAPGENKTVIFEAKAGLEVEIVKLENEYVQIRSPGAFSGWIQKSQIEILGR
jgi:hypothetical protein